MEFTKILQVLSNKTRLDILYWLADPKAYFNDDGRVPDAAFENGVCVNLIQRKSKLSQATVSQYMALLKAAGLVEATRVGKWTHYRRNENALTKLLETFRENLLIGD